MRLYTNLSSNHFGVTAKTGANSSPEIQEKIIGQFFIPNLFSERKKVFFISNKSTNQQLIYKYYINNIIRIRCKLVDSWGNNLLVARNNFKIKLLK